MSDSSQLDNSVGDVGVVDYDNPDGNPHLRGTSVIGSGDRPFRDNTSVDLAVNPADPVDLSVEGTQVASGIRDGHREVVRITESMGDYLQWTVGGSTYHVGIPDGVVEDRIRRPQLGPAPDDDEPQDVDSAPHRGSEGGPANTVENEQAAYRDVEKNANGAPQGTPDPSTYRELANWDWVPDAIPSSGRRAAGLLAAGIVALVVLPVLAASGSSSSSTSSSDGGDR